jgi:hypothetical protein
MKRGERREESATSIFSLLVRIKVRVFSLRLTEIATVVEVEVECPWILAMEGKNERNVSFFLLLLSELGDPSLLHVHHSTYVSVAIVAFLTSVLVSSFRCITVKKVRLKAAELRENLRNLEVPPPPWSLTK